jgi:hypothetical protein
MKSDGRLHRYLESLLYFSGVKYLDMALGYPSIEVLAEAV